MTQLVNLRRGKYSGYIEHQTKVHGDIPVILWYKIDAGDKAMKDVPIVEHCSVTDIAGNDLNDALEDWEVHLLIDEAEKTRIARRYS